MRDTVSSLPTGTSCIYHDKPEVTLCSCFQDPRICILTFCCPCYTLGRNAEFIGESCWKHALMCLFCCNSGPIIRWRLRKELHIEGSMLRDVLQYMFFPCCALTRDARQMDWEPPGCCECICCSCCDCCGPLDYSFQEVDIVTQTPHGTQHIHHGSQHPTTPPISPAQQIINQPLGMGGPQGMMHTGGIGMSSHYPHHHRGGGLFGHHHHGYGHQRGFGHHRHHSPFHSPFHRSHQHGHRSMFGSRRNRRY